MKSLWPVTVVAGCAVLLLLKFGLDQRVLLYLGAALFSFPFIYLSETLAETVGAAGQWVKGMYVDVATPGLMFVLLGWLWLLGVSGFSLYTAFK